MYGSFKKIFAVVSLGIVSSCSAIGADYIVYPTPAQLLGPLVMPSYTPHRVRSTPKIKNTVKPLKCLPIESSADIRNIYDKAEKGMFRAAENLHVLGTESVAIKSNTFSEESSHVNLRQTGKESSKNTTTGKESSKNTNITTEISRTLDISPVIIKKREAAIQAYDEFRNSLQQKQTSPQQQSSNISDDKYTKAYFALLSTQKYVQCLTKDNWGYDGSELRGWIVGWQKDYVWFVRQDDAAQVKLDYYKFTPKDQSSILDYIIFNCQQQTVEKANYSRVILKKGGTDFSYIARERENLKIEFEALLNVDLEN